MIFTIYGHNLEEEIFLSISAVERLWYSVYTMYCVDRNCYSIEEYAYIKEKLYEDIKLTCDNAIELLWG